jgi:hypothetical protein
MIIHQMIEKFWAPTKNVFGQQSKKKFQVATKNL